MPAKRTAPAAAPNPSPKKIKTPGTSPTLFPVAQHPTLSLLESGLAHALPFWKGTQQAKAAGGLDEFDIDAYKHSMRQYKEYSCLVPACAIPPLTTTHAHAVPAWASLECGSLIEQHNDESHVLVYMNVF
jgi:hypothetical protein